MKDIPHELKNVIWDGLCTQGMVTLIGGPFLSAFLVLLGANYFWIGVAAAVPPLAQLIQIPSIFLVEAYPHRRRICVVSAFISRLFWLIPIIAVFTAKPRFILVFTLIAIAAQAAIGAISGTSWNSWMRDLIPTNILGRFFSHRMKLATLVGMISSVVAGIFVDQYNLIFEIREIDAYGIIFSVGLIFAFLGVYFLAVTPEPKMAIEKGQSIFTKLKLPFLDKKYRSTILFLGLWNFSINLSIPFFVVYMLTRLGYSMGLIILLSVISQLANFFSFGMWGRFSDHFSNKTVLAVSGPMFLFVILLWPFTTLPQQHFLTIPLLVLIHILGGFSTAGTNLAASNLALKEANPGQATSYLAINSVISSVAMFAAPLVGGAIAHYFSVRELAIEVNWVTPGTEVTFQTLNFKELDFLFFISAIVGFVVIQILAYIQEEGVVSEKVLLKELRGQMQRNILNISSITGFRFLVGFPYQMIRRPVTTIRKVRESIKSSAKKE